MTNVACGNLRFVFHAERDRFEGIVLETRHKVGLTLFATETHRFFEVGELIALFNCDLRLLEPEEWEE